MDRARRDQILEHEKSLQDGRLHDVSIDGGPERPDLEPGIDLGGASGLHASLASDPGLRASSVSDGLPRELPHPPPVDVAADGITDSADRIEPGTPGTHVAGIIVGDEDEEAPGYGLPLGATGVHVPVGPPQVEQRAERALASERGTSKPAKDPEPH